MRHTPLIPRSALAPALLLALLAWAAAQAETPAAPAAKPLPNVRPEIQFDSESHDFGDLADGGVVKHAFKFKNMGLATLVIDRVKAG